MLAADSGFWHYVVQVTHLLGLKQLAMGLQLEVKVGCIGQDHDNAACPG